MRAHLAAWILGLALIGVALAYEVYFIHLGLRGGEAGVSAPSAPSQSPPPGATGATTPGADLSPSTGVSGEAGQASTRPTNSGAAVAPRRPPITLPAPASFVDRFRELNVQERWYVSDGWNNGDWISSDWRARQTAISPEGLVLTLARAPRGSDKPYMSGEVQSLDHYRYGYFETRMRVPRGSGLVTGVFTYTRAQGNATWNEIDIEILGRNTRRVELTYHVGGRAHNQNLDLPFDAADGFHTYAFEWREDALRWYVDNVMVHQFQGGSVSRLVRPQRFYINLWNTDALRDWVGPVDASQAPWRLTVSCVAYALSYDGRSLCTP